MAYKQAQNYYTILSVANGQQTVQYLVSRVQQRTNTALIWQSTNPVLMAGEIGIESDTTRLKIGDGLTPWNDLSYASTISPTYTAAAGIVINNNEISATLLYDEIELS